MCLIILFHHWEQVSFEQDIFGGLRYANPPYACWLKARDPKSGIRNFEDLALLARQHGMVLHADHEMPVNNRTLVWRRV